MNVSNTTVTGVERMLVNPRRARAMYRFRYFFVDPKGDTMVALQIWVDVETGSITGGVI